MVLMSYTLSFYFVGLHIDNRVKFHFNKGLYIIKGKVVDVSFRDTTKVVSLETENITNLENNLQIAAIPKYITMRVSPLENFQLYDNLEVVGEISTQNNFSDRIIPNRNFVPVQHSNEKLFLNTDYQVSNLKDIIVTQNNFHSKSLWERIKIVFYETSDGIKSRPDDFIKDPYLGISKGITFGDQENIIKDIKNVFINSGLIHIMVLSGANVSFIILVFFFLLQRFSVRVRVWTTLLLSTIFIFGTGLTAPSVRAGVMVNTTLLSEFYSKNFSIKNSILLSLFVLTVINPFVLVYSASLHLSYLAIIGLVFVVPKISKIIGIKLDPENIEILSLLNVYKKHFWKATLAIFLSITISVGPYLLALSEQINLFGTLATIFLEPIILCVTVLTFLTTLTSFVSTFLAQTLGTINSFFISIILQAAEFFAQEIFIINFSINHTFVKIYYLVFIVYFFILNHDYTD
jgi:ComEC/Rec2-related protein